MQTLFDTIEFIPAQKGGKQLDLEYSITLERDEDAVDAYRSACQRLLNPFIWHQLAGAATANFSIYEKQNINRGPVQKGDHLAIDIGLSGILASKSHDWVVVEDIQENVIPVADESTGIKLTACADPLATSDTAKHFFTKGAATVIIIRRTGNVVTANYHGRNERPNVKTGDTVENIRNGIIAFGAIAGLSNLQWNALLKGLLSEPGTENI